MPESVQIFETMFTVLFALCIQCLSIQYLSSTEVHPGCQHIFLKRGVA